MNPIQDSPCTLAEGQAQWANLAARRVAAKDLVRTWQLEAHFWDSISRLPHIYVKAKLKVPYLWSINTRISIPFGATKMRTDRRIEQKMAMKNFLNIAGPRHSLREAKGWRKEK